MKADLQPPVFLFAECFHWGPLHYLHSGNRKQYIFPILCLLVEQKNVLHFKKCLGSLSYSNDNKDRPIYAIMFLFYLLLIKVFSRVFHSYINVTFTEEWLQNWDILLGA